MKRQTIIKFISFLFIILFLYTGISKLIEYDVAVEQVALTPLLAPVAGVLMIVLPIVEILTAIFLFIPATRRKALFLSLMLMALFTCYVIYILNVDNTLPCTCGGIIESLTWKQHLVANISLMFLAGIGIVLWRRHVIQDLQVRKAGI